MYHSETQKYEKYDGYFITKLKEVKMDPDDVLDIDLPKSKIKFVATCILPSLNEIENKIKEKLNTISEIISVKFSYYSTHTLVKTPKVPKIVDGYSYIGKVELAFYLIRDKPIPRTTYDRKLRASYITIGHKKKCTYYPKIWYSDQLKIYKICVEISFGDIFEYGEMLGYEKLCKLHEEKNKLDEKLMYLKHENEELQDLVKYIPGIGEKFFEAKDDYEGKEGQDKLLKNAE